MTQNKTKIRVFPDFMSSGFWVYPYGANLCESEFESVLPPPLMIALKYWHWIWESNFDYIELEHTMSKDAQQVWEQDGITLVEAMNACQDEYEFVYKGDNW